MKNTTTNDIKDFINTNYSFFTEDTRNKMILGINNYLHPQQSYNSEEIIKSTIKTDTIELLKQKMIATFRKKGDDKMLVTGRKSYSGNEIADAVEKETELGVNTLNNIIQLSLDLISRDKIHLGDKKVTEYYAVATQLSESEDLMCCTVQEGTGNTLETSELIERYLPYSAMKSIITNKITDDLYVTPEQYFKYKIIEDVANNTIEYQFFAVEQTKELEELFKIPDYFKDIDERTLKFLKSE